MIFRSLSQSYWPTVTVAPCDAILDSLAFWIPRFEFRITGAVEPRQPLYLFIFWGYDSRCLNYETISKDESYIIKVYFYCTSKGCFFLDILISLHVLILKSILFIWLQLQRLSRSRWNKTWSWGLSTIWEALQSSAYRATVFPGEMQYWR